MEDIVEHLVKYEGAEFSITGVFEKPDETTGYKGGFSWYTISVEGVDFSWMLKDKIIEILIAILVDENY